MPIAVGSAISVMPVMIPAGFVVRGDGLLIDVVYIE